MPRFFFHVRNQTSYVRDEVGSELAGLSSARDQASNTVGEILTSDLRDGRLDVVFDVDIEDADGTRLLTFEIVARVRSGEPE